MKKIGLIVFAVMLVMAFISCGDKGSGDPSSPVCTHTPGAAATCTTPQTCTSCSAILKAALGHLGDWEAMDSNTPCLEERDCERCGVYQTRHVDAGCTGTIGLDIESGTVTNINKTLAVTHLCIPDFNPATDDEVTGIFQGAFEYNTNIVSVRAGANLTDIFEGAFFHCTSLKSISFPAVTYIDGDAFNNCTSLSNASFPEATVIKYDAFSGCESLKSVSFPEAMKIEHGAFYSCTSLLNASFPKATEILNNAFKDCVKLAQVTLGAGVNITNANAFPGDLYSVYTTGGSLAGTYVSNLATPPEWTKQ